MGYRGALVLSAVHLAAGINTSMRTFQITAAMMPMQREREREAVLAAIFSALNAMRAGRAC